MKRGMDVEVLADSIGPNDRRLVTIRAKYPRAMHADFMTYRCLERNGASSRAKPVGTVLWEVLTDPWIPAAWLQNQKGMRAAGPLPWGNAAACRFLWLWLRNLAVVVVWLLLKLGLTKQHANRLLEPWHHIIMIYTGNIESWHHVFNQRCHPDAMPEFQKLACMIALAIRRSVPRILEAGEYHLPMVDPEEFEAIGQDNALLVSAARCARTSYGTFEEPSRPSSLEADEKLAGKLMAASPMHATPLGHQAMACVSELRSGPFTGWRQYRKRFDGEWCPDFDYDSPEFRALCRRHGLL